MEPPNKPSTDRQRLSTGLLLLWSIAAVMIFTAGCLLNIPSENAAAETLGLFLAGIGGSMMSPVFGRIIRTLTDDEDPPDDEFAAKLDDIHRMSKKVERLLDYRVQLTVIFLMIGIGVLGIVALGSIPILPTILVVTSALLLSFVMLDNLLTTHRHAVVRGFLRVLTPLIRAWVRLSERSHD